jgi:hypothetical protein
VREFLTEVRPVLEGVSVARREGAVGSVNVGERSRSVVLHLEEPIRMVERLREPQERHGPEWWRRLETGGLRRRAGAGALIVPAPMGGTNSIAQMVTDPSARSATYGD